LTGGTPVTLCEAENPYGASWSADGFILYGQGAGGIWRVSENGGSPERLVEVAAGEMAASPEMLPGGTTLLFTLAEAGSSWDDAQIVAQSLATGDRNVLVRGGADARYVSTGHLVYAVGATLMAVAFDAGALEVHGGPAPVVEGVRRSTADTGAAHFTVSDTGALAYVPGSGGLALAQVDRTGQTEPLTERVAVFRLPRLSPVGKRLAVGVQDQSSSDIWILDIARDSLTRLTTEGSNRQPLWSPDGEWIVYTSGDGNLYRIRSDFSGSAELLLDKENEQFAQAWSRDGEWIVFLDIQGEELDLWTLPLGDDGEPRPVVRTPFMEAVPSLSPDGRFIAYHSNESGDYEIYVQPFPEGGRRWPISTEGGMDPVWSADGREIFFRNGSAMMGVSVSTAPEFRVGVPELLFQRPYNYRNGRNYDVAPDGKHFVMIDAAGVTGAERSRVDVVLGWFQELERLVPTD
jgi:Tol biopolymer transport system component